MSNPVTICLLSRSFLFLLHFLSLSFPFFSLSLSLSFLFVLPHYPLSLLSSLLLSTLHPFYPLTTQHLYIPLDLLRTSRLYYLQSDIPSTGISPFFH